MSTMTVSGPLAKPANPDQLHPNLLVVDYTSVIFVLIAIVIVMAIYISSLRADIDKSREEFMLMAFRMARGPDPLKTSV